MKKKKILIGVLTLFGLASGTLGFASCNMGGTGGNGVGSGICSHSLVYSPEKAATCTNEGKKEYWRCEICNGIFNKKTADVKIDPESMIIPATGHTPVTDEAIAPTQNTTGLKEGSHCSVCNEVLVEQEVIPALKDSQFSIVYHVAINDNYLQQQQIENNNPTAYTTEDSFMFEDLIVPGYVFCGWFTSQIGGERVVDVEKGTKGNKVLYAQWEKVEYTITFDSPDVPVESITYTVDKGATLKNPSWFGYTFVGWSRDGEIVSVIHPGTTGNMMLHANWTSDRNKAKAVNNLSDPSIIEDMDNGRYLFIYEIGTIENVPLAEIEYLGNTENIEINKSYTCSISLGEGYANTIANTISNATTKTSAWTLSQEWNDATTATNEHDEQIGKTEQKTDSEGNVTGGEYYISNSSGGSTAVSSNSGGSNSSSSKVTTNNSTGINGSYTKENEKSSSVGLHIDGSFSHEAQVGVAAARTNTNITVSAGANGEWTEGEKKAATLAASREKNVGSESSSNSSSYWDRSSSSSSNWNTTDGYKNSQSVSKNTEISNAISQLIYDKYAYTSMQSRGESNSATQSTGSSQELKDEYTSTIEYSVENQQTYQQEVRQSSSARGYYRLVTAGTVHVFAVVGYDFATNSYFTYTYNILDQERHVYLDYSKDNANFNDCENGVLPFEVPYYVHEVVSGVIARSDGLTIDLATGYITEYNGTAENVVIPEYVSVNNADGTYSAVRVRGIEADAFKGNIQLKGVILPKYVSVIPASAFEGCTSLEVVMGYGIMEIGDNAFKGCTSLKKFAIDEYVTSLGPNAFEGVKEITVKAINTSVAEQSVHSGATRITLDISLLENGFHNQEIVIGAEKEYFALIGNGSTYENLQVRSEAAETFISHMTFTKNTDTPLYLKSKTVTLGRVTIENAPGFALVLAEEDVALKLLGTISVSSLGENTVISKSVTFSKADEGVKGELNVSKRYLVCGTLTNDQMLIVPAIREDNIKYIGEETFESMLTSSIVTFDANGGTVSETTKTVYYGQVYGTLPTPERANFTFGGWFSEAVGGSEVVADTIVSALVNQTLYAQWTPNMFTVNFDANGGTVSTASNILTFGDNYGTLPTPTRDCYSFNGWYTAKNGGERVTESTVPSVAQDVTLYAQWTLKTFTLSFDPNGGNVSSANKTVVCGQAYGALPTPTRDYYNFDGWYTLVSGGSRVTEESVSWSENNVTIYAHWNRNDTAWCEISKLPAGAQELAYEWRYTLTETKTSPDAALSGWTQIGSNWLVTATGSVNYATFPTGYDTTNTYYTTFAKSAYTAYNNGSTKREVVNKKAGYIYWHWMYDVAYANTTERAISHRKGSWTSTGKSGGNNYKYFFAIASSVNCPYLDTYYCCNQGLKSYNCHSIIKNTKNVGTPRCFRFEYSTSTYTDSQLIYTYQKVTMGVKSSTEVKEGGGISNVEKWVQYRTK
ncbi:MAG: hypothetical protein E7366_04860 [Clostridiales bacterium]|nr:hypothetical protein [Clostridiales bacterium]